ncbi:zinc finger protein 354C-like isoform X2 [Wyeomyia smithii]|uniref:zinc finger protein 354C-like isoform X2 n=1 Tax=Wyeomyia smithii TaxID=174621 RepID=UPI002467CBC5|nr:zinc finger protein 354C-like isoform X2 [Wyeomyia smithii]XP_055536235.1 zinc finger protein 354C-like isoform X2 [Wyeomyia smithii]
MLRQQYMDSIKTTCRLCLDVFTELGVSIEDDTIRHKIVTLFRLQLDVNANLPKKVCSRCSVKVNDFYIFSEMVQSNEQQLKNEGTMQPLMSMVDIKKETPFTQQIQSGHNSSGSVSTSDENCAGSINLQVELELLKAEEGDGTDHTEDEIPLAKRRSKQAEENLFFKDYYFLECETCHLTFKTFQDFNGHTLDIHNKPPTIQCCNRKITSKLNILNHIKKHITSKRFKCECGKSFTGKYSYKQHLANHVAKSYKCMYCSIFFKTRTGLNNHQRTHTSLQCTICQKILAGEKSLQKHMSSVHDAVNAKKYICDCCGQEFRTRSALNRHIKKQHLGVRETRVQCELCETWLNKTNMKAHLRTVHIEANSSLTCDVCQNVYPNRKSLVTHKWRVHVEEKFQCEVCGKKFKRSICLREHRAAHSGMQTLYECDVCGKTTNSNGNLYSHKKTKHPDEWLEAKRKAAEEGS